MQKRIVLVAFCHVGYRGSHDLRGETVTVADASRRLPCAQSLQVLHTTPELIARGTLERVRRRLPTCDCLAPTYGSTSAQWHPSSSSASPSLVSPFCSEMVRSARDSMALQITGHHPHLSRGVTGPAIA